LPVRRGDPTGVSGLIDRVSTPDYATAVGLILHGFSRWQEHGLAQDTKKGLWAKMREWLKE
jgi:cell division protein FtsA